MLHRVQSSRTRPMTAATDNHQRARPSGGASLCSHPWSRTRQSSTVSTLNRQRLASLALTGSTDDSPGVRWVHIVMILPTLQMPPVASIVRGVRVVSNVPASQVL